jgi:ABC-type polar amino acid transport system ATPase subunit
MATRKRIAPKISTEGKVWLQTLSPTQEKVVANLLESLAFGRIMVIWGGSGFGKTTMLNKLREVKFPDAPMLSTIDFLSVMQDRDPFALEEAYAGMLLKALDKHDTLLVDDLHLLNDALCCGYAYPRKDYFVGPLTAVVAEAVRTEKRLIFTSRGSAPRPIANRCYYHGIKQLVAEDYEHICASWLANGAAPRLNFAKIHRFAPKLNGHQLRGASQELRLDPKLDTETFIEYLRARRMASNVDLAEVQAVELHSLKGLDDIIESLEANVVLPFENDRLADELQIKPKRGVLIIGPPGTGKTTVGRALAHRLKSKFFLIDGTFISGTSDFYDKIQNVVEAAKQNSPSIIFIDDSDVIFETEKEQGLYRYLLTLLDGIESDSSAQVCVMLTAMDVGGLPPALIRSGRIELWLETRLPDAAARTQILEDLVAMQPEAFARPDVARIALATDGLTGADLKRLVDDGKILYAFDKARSKPMRSTTEYILSAIEPVRANKARYAAAEARIKSMMRITPEDQYRLMPSEPDEPI